MITSFLICQTKLQTVSHKLIAVKFLSNMKSFDVENDDTAANDTQNSKDI